MKKLLLITTIFFGLQVYAQKTFEVYNFSNQTINVTDIITNASGAYPEFSVKYFGPIVLAPLDSYTLQNTLSITRFPFDSPSSSPYIGSWERLDSAIAPIFMMTAYGAWLMGDPQVFDRMVFSIGGTSYTVGTATPLVNGGGWTAVYSLYTTTTPPVSIYTVVIF